MWILAQTIASAEFQARDRLADLAIEAYVPTFKRQIQPRHTHGRRIVELPLFARYLFLESFDVGRTMADLRQAAAFARPVRSDLGHALIVPDRDLDAVRARATAGAYDIAPDAAPFPEGVRCLVSIGLVSRPATVQRVLSHQRRKLSLDNSALTIVASVDLLSFSE